MNFETYMAVAELAQAAAHSTGFVGPVEFGVCRHRELCSNDEDEPSDEPSSRDLLFHCGDAGTNPLDGTITEIEEFFYAQHGF